MSVQLKPGVNAFQFLLGFYVKIRKGRGASYRVTFNSFWDSTPPAAFLNAATERTFNSFWDSTIGQEAAEIAAMLLSIPFGILPYYAP